MLSNLELTQCTYPALSTLSHEKTQIKAVGHVFSSSSCLTLLFPHVAQLDPLCPIFRGPEYKLVLHDHHIHIYFF